MRCKATNFLFIFIIVILLIVSFKILNSYAQPYLCGSSGLVYSDQGLCDSVCGATNVCQSNATTNANGTLTCSNGGTLQTSGICTTSPNNGSCPTGYQLLTNGCSDLTSTTNGTSGSCPSSGYEGFIYDSTTGYTYAVTTTTNFWTAFNQTNNNPSLAVIPSAAVNTALSQILSYYQINKAWIGAYDSGMSTSYNITDSQNYFWWNSVGCGAGGTVSNGQCVAAPSPIGSQTCPAGYIYSSSSSECIAQMSSNMSYTNWASNQPYNLLNSQDIGVVSKEGNHWAYMSLDGTWSSDGYHYNYPSAQNYAPYYNALVQWNGPLNCVNGNLNSSTNQPVTQPNGNAAAQQYCNGQTPCYMCTDTSQCTPQNECPTGYSYNSTNNDCEADASCPSGGTINTNGNCSMPTNPSCPNNYTYNSTNNDCEANAIQGCNNGGTLSSGQCVLVSSNGCPSYYAYNSTNNDCEASPSTICPSGTTANIIQGQDMCQTNPTYSCADSSYSYNTLVANQCAANANIQCPVGGTYSGGQCLSTTSPCPNGYTQNGGLCTAQATVTCPGSGTYSDIFNDCIETAQPVCLTGFTYTPSDNDMCIGAPTGYNCPTGGNYNSSEEMCSASVIQGCPSGYSLVDNQCISQVAYTCPQPGSYNANENACSAQVTSYNCPTGYTYADNKCVSSSGCPSPGSYNTAESSCSSPLLPCSPTTNNMKECISTATGQVCPFNQFVCTQTNNNQFTESGISGVVPYTIGFQGFSLSGNNTVPDGNVSFYNINTSLAVGNYTISLEGDNLAFIYINGKLVSSSGSVVPQLNYQPVPTTASFTSNGGYISIFIVLMNGSYATIVNPVQYSNPVGVNVTITDSSGKTVISNTSNWQGSLDPADFNYQAVCPSGYAFSKEYNACIAAGTGVCSSGYNYNSNNNDCEAPAQCPSGTTIINNQCQSTPTCPNGGGFNGNICILSVSSYSCPVGGVYNGLQCVAVPQCPSGYSYNSTNQDCEEATTPTCPSNYTYNGSQCTAISICPSGGYYNGSECAANSTTTNVYTNPTTTYSCSQGMYDTTTGLCVYNGLYQIVLNRQPDPGGFYYWQSTFSTPPTYNNILDFVAAGVINYDQGTETYVCGFQNNPSINTTLGQQVISAYVWYLGRCPGNTGFNYWVGASTATGSLNLTAFENTAEPECSSRGGGCPYTPPLVYTTSPYITNQCPAGYGYNSGIDECVGTVSTCPSGYTYNGSQCTATPICPSGGYYNGYQCVASVNYSCPSGGYYNGSECVVNYSCPSSYSKSGGTCVAASTPVCPSGYTYNSSTKQCNASAQCPSGTNLIGGVCTAPITCPSGSSYNNSEQQCSTTVTSYSCPSGGYYSVNYKYCYIQPNVSFGSICPNGQNSPCLPNGQGQYVCSANPCDNISNPNNIQQEPGTNPNDKTNNGTVTNQGCNGNIYIFNGQTFDCREPGIEDGFADCCSSSKDWLGLGKCWQNEAMLQQKKQAGFCHYVGTFCTAKFLGVCLQQDKAYCCFDGVLARIIQEQGRLQSLPQAGWGSAESPNCEGFTPTQFQALDWSKINLSEYYAYIEQTFIPNMQKSINTGINNAVNKLQQGYSGKQ